MDKSPDAFRTISEVADVLETPAHVLRFWESRFPQLKPVKRAGGRRYYRPSDVALLSGIKRLLHDEGLTIRGVQKILRDQGARHVAGLSDDSVDLSGDLAALAGHDEAALRAALADEEAGDEVILRFRPTGPLTLTEAAFGAFDDPEDNALPDNPADAETDLPLFPAVPDDPAQTGPTPRSHSPSHATGEASIASRIRSLQPGALSGAQPELGLLAQKLTRLRARMGDRAEGSQG